MKAYSITELLLVVALLSIIASVATRSIAHTRNSLMIRTETRVLTSILREEVSRALSISQDLELLIDVAHGQVSRLEGEKRSLLYETPKGIRIAAARFGQLKGSRSRLTLRKDGSTSPGRIVLEGKSSCEIVVSLRGALRERCYRDD